MVVDSPFRYVFTPDVLAMSESLVARRKENVGGINMFSNLTTSAITTEATNWAAQFDDLLLVVVGLGIGFAAVRFVKSMFF